MSPVTLMRDRGMLELSYCLPVHLGPYIIGPEMSMAVLQYHRTTLVPSGAEI
jgi:hypothetical protein